MTAIDIIEFNRVLHLYTSCLICDAPKSFVTTWSMSLVPSITSLPSDIIGILVLLTYDGLHIPSMLLTCRAWAGLSSWVGAEMRFKRCMAISGVTPWIAAVNFEWLDRGLLKRSSSIRQ